MERVLRRSRHGLSRRDRRPRRRRLPLSPARRGELRLSLRSVACASRCRRSAKIPATLPQTYAKLLNSVIAGKPADMVVAMHLCRGNSRSAWIAEGGYEPVAEVLFNEVNVDGYFLEYDSPRAGDFAPLRFVPKGKTIVLGLVTTKTAQLEKKDDLKPQDRRSGEILPARSAGAQSAMRLRQRARRQQAHRRRRDREAEADPRRVARGVGVSA